MTTAPRPDPRHVPGAYVRRAGRVYEVLVYERTGAWSSELWLEDICTYERLALNTFEQNALKLVRQAPPQADPIVEPTRSSR